MSFWASKKPRPQSARFSFGSSLHHGIRNIGARRASAFGGVERDKNKWQFMPNKTREPQTKAGLKKSAKSQLTAFSDWLARLMSYFSSSCPHSDISTRDILYPCNLDLLYSIGMFSNNFAGCESKASMLKENGAASPASINCRSTHESPFLKLMAQKAREFTAVLSQKLNGSTSEHMQSNHLAKERLPYRLSSIFIPWGYGQHSASMTSANGRHNGDITSFSLYSRDCPAIEDISNSNNIVCDTGKNPLPRDPECPSAYDPSIKSLVNELFNDFMGNGCKEKCTLATENGCLTSTNPGPLQTRLTYFLGILPITFLSSKEATLEAVVPRSKYLGLDHQRKDSQNQHSHVLKNEEKTTTQSATSEIGRRSKICSVLDLSSLGNWEDEEMVLAGLQLGDTDLQQSTAKPTIEHENLFLTHPENFPRTQDTKVLDTSNSNMDDLSSIMSLLIARHLDQYEFADSATLASMGLVSMGLSFEEGSFSWVSSPVLQLKDEKAKSNSSRPIIQIFEGAS
ncbi:hypothetical protein METBIDRAFT_229836 [Metschnikowia bicuspidata var. bicuspidata NRRL YB-4993]|uniref:Uncharacterized protein n=1 Tax=Metschnikowia bicuspidata var. bicuspidata NRRL YB-4993 TaxID=869754 RepID=A0A1A0HC93_9ASCO|nr:hypothetical protein METBIDRAFT_229836 [Metschnikowia bicuspidata var. bicuspidata NRRL YB-4993]OBA21518.1 hypothetical protein METBIDRAFT_229836 [Metschnikowia bicuspidata var. bicuspidata NRRL YB-4993]